MTSPLPASLALALAAAPLLPRAHPRGHPPAGADLNARFLPNGTPSLVAGSKVLITDRAAARTFDACPGGSCWRPVWSPDGNALAFYSDLGGQIGRAHV